MKKRSLFHLLAVFALLLFQTQGAYAVDADGDGIDDAVDANPGYALRVNTMPNGVITPIGNGDSQPYAYPGLSLDVWGAVTFGAAPYSWIWNFGDGSPNATGTATTTTAARNISAAHAYVAGSYLATLTVTDNTGRVESSILKLDVVPMTDNVKVNLAIQKAMKYLYLNRSLSGSSAYFSNYEDTPLAVLAFEDHGHRAKNDVTKDIYAPLVQQGLNYLFNNFAYETISIDPDTGVASDSDGNGKGVYYYTRNLYHQGCAMMALANTSDPAAVVTLGSQAGRTYAAVLRDMVDWTAWAQNDTSSSRKGGWRYYPNYGSSDNSVSQWPVLGLASAEPPPWNISAPSFVKTKLPAWIAYSQCSNGGFGYTYAGYWCNVAKTGAGVIGMKYAGYANSDPRMVNALAFLTSNWGSTSYDYGNIGDHYAMYAVKKGLGFAGVTLLGAYDWQKEYNTWYVANQNASGYWAGSVRISAGIEAASLGLLVLAPGLVELPPVANAGIDQIVNPGVNVSFDGSASYHSDPTKHIVGYKWDFDASNGVNWASPDATGQIVTKMGGYPDTGSNYDVTATLQVIDEDGRTSLDTANVRVQTGNVPPVADAGGPYLAAVGEDITLDGSGSHDPNAGPPLNDFIALYEWDIDGDGAYDDATGVSPTVNFGPAFEGTKTIGLRVTDSFGATAAASTMSTTVAVSNLQPASYGCLVQTLNRLTGITTITRCMTLSNLGTGAAGSITATMSSIPFGVTVIDGALSWPGTIAGGASAQSGDTFQYSYRRGTGVDLTRITWDIEFTDALGTRHVVRNVPQ